MVTPPDLQPPTGSVLVNNGDSYASNAMVTLTLSASDNVGVTEMRLFYDASWHDWERYASIKSVTLTGGDGTQAVSVEYRDAADHTSTTYSDNIILDTAPPSSAVDALPPTQNSISLAVS